MPHTLVIVGSLIVLVLVMSWVIPSGSYQRVEQEGRQVTVSGTYQQVEKVWLGPHWLMIAPIRGFLDGAAVILGASAGLWALITLAVSRLGLF